VSDVDAVSYATPMHQMVMPAIPEESLMDMFLGNIPGCIGEVSALALLAGGAYLVWNTR
jgi:electron transport complex protein RnfD